jgi:hypothetical protein
MQRACGGGLRHPAGCGETLAPVELLQSEALVLENSLNPNQARREAVALWLSAAVAISLGVAVLITNQSELRNRGFRALVEALGWVNAVRFLRQYDPGSGNYTEERRELLPDWDASTLLQQAKELPKPPGSST